MMHSSNRVRDRPDRDRLALRFEHIKSDSVAGFVTENTLASHNLQAQGLFLESGAWKERGRTRVRCEAGAFPAGGVPAK
jgi:hypothetical protein